tara:strand:+ start:409 stop:948 length:540 start_codon:yes stop_codon:yes gene_type:complete
MAGTQDSTTTDTKTPQARGRHFKTIALAAGLLLAEAALFVGGFMYLSPDAGTADTVEIFAEESPVMDRISEIELVDEKMTNDRLGAVYVYPVEVYVHVPEDHALWLSDLVGQFQNEIRAEMAALWRQADPAVLQDPRMKVMTDRIETLLRTRFEGEAKPELSRIVKVVIVSGTGFRIRS